jgi:hypothetical protein
MDVQVKVDPVINVPVYLIVAIGMFFVLAAILMSTLNYILPRMIKNVAGDRYDDQQYTNITYRTSMAITLMIMCTMNTI